MSDISTSTDFVLVSRRKKGICREKTWNIHLAKITEVDDIDENIVLRKISDAVAELSNSEFNVDVFDSVSKSLKILNASNIFEIICYGLGRFSQNRSSKYQLALLLLLKSRYNCTVQMYDPMFLDKEIKILKELGLHVLERNEEGKRVVSERVTLVYMPHCSKQLTNNFLYANWGEKLSNCILISNSFAEIIDESVEKYLINSAGYILRIQPYVTETKLKNNFTYNEVFTSCSVHVFTELDSNKIPLNFWTCAKEPVYLENDLEYVVNETKAL